MEILIAYFLIGFLIGDIVRIINSSNQLSVNNIFNIFIRSLVIFLLIIVAIVLK